MQREGFTRRFTSLFQIACETWDAVQGILLQCDVKYLSVLRPKVHDVKSVFRPRVSESMIQALIFLSGTSITLFWFIMMREKSQNASSWIKL